LKVILTKRSVFRSAITGSDGEVDAGYLAMFWLMAVVIGIIPIIVGVALWKGSNVQDLGVAVGSICGGFGVAVGAVGAFRMGDKPHPSTHENNEGKE
jgi:hypothetical protein